MIKYRVYDTEDKEYLDSFRTAVTPDGEVFVLSDYKYNDDGQEIWEAKLVCSARQEPGRFIIEQYTGLKDKNGVEIAVGDILGLYEIYVDPDGTEAEWLEPWGEVVRTATAVMVKSVRTGTLTDIIYDEEDPSKPMAEVEVIGNIHENAELLEAKDE